MDQYLFSDLKVIDNSAVIAGPSSAMILADFGADVIKVEKPPTGDSLRHLSALPGTPDAPSNYLWQMDGKNKRSIMLDLKTAEGIEIMRRLVAQCDVYITNQPLSVRESLGLTYEELKQLNPSMIFASLTAYGEEGPDKYRKGFDQLAYWARSGLMDLMRQPGTAPTQGLPGMGDRPTAISIYGGIVTALLHRERTGEGSLVCTSLLANGLWSASCIAQGVMAGGDMPLYRERRLVPGMLGRVYQASDGRWLMFNMVRSEELLALMFAGLEALHLLEDERFDTAEKIRDNRQPLGELVQEIIGQRTSGDWLKIYAELEVPVVRVGRVEETADDPQIQINNMVAKPETDDIDVPLLIRHPIQVSAVQPVTPKRAPDLGEHSAEILQELGYSDESIAAFRDKGAI